MAIMVVVNRRDGHFSAVAKEVVSYGAALAEQLSMPALAVSFGDINPEQANEIAAAGIANVVSVANNTSPVFDDAIYAEYLYQLAEAKSAKIIVMAHNAKGKALAPRISVKMKAAFLAAVDGMPVNTSPLTLPRKAFTGKAIAHIAAQTDKCILTVSPNACEIKETGLTAQQESFTPQVSQSSKMKLIDKEESSGKLVLTEADVVVSGGRGMKGPEKWPELEKLAGLLGAATACSRPVADEKWRPEEEHVGQTGKIVAPKLYFALGISGAIQHIGGISSSKCIVAVNKDKDAPIFKVADYGIVGDLDQILPNLIQSVEKKM